MRTPDELQLRGTDPGAPCVLIRRGARSRFVGLAFRAADAADVAAAGRPRPARTVRQAAGEPGRDRRSSLLDPSGQRVRVVADTHELPALPGQAPLTWSTSATRSTADERPQRPPREPAQVQRLGHVVLQTTTLPADAGLVPATTSGLIVSDFLYYPGQRDRGPVMSFIRCDRGATPTDHHTLAHGAGPGQPLRALRLPGRRPRRAGRRRGIPARARATSARGGSAGTSRAARSSTTGATPTGSWSSTSATATCSTARSSPAGRR